MKPRLLDLFCGAGGAAMGYHQAGFDVVGVDITEQPDYPFERFVGDAVEWVDNLVHSIPFDAIHASPPCQAYTTMNNRHASSSPPLIDKVRRLLVATGLPYVIKNVCGARRHMESPILLHGGMFGLDVYRPRLFESNMLLWAPSPAPVPKNAKAIYGARPDGRLLWRRNDGSELRCATLDEARVAMEMPWADWHGVKEAIPPAYTEYIGTQLLAYLEATV